MHRFLLYFIGLIGFYDSPSNLIANPSIFTDKVIVHLNQSFYVNGDRIWYKIYLPSTYKDIDLPIKVTLINKDKSVIQEGYINTKGHTFIDGQLKIPLDIPSDTYHLVAYGTHNRTKNFLRIAEVFVPIYNDLQKTLPVTPLEQQAALTPNKTIFVNELAISIKVHTTTLAKRQKINASVEVLDKNGKPVKANLSIAVRDAALTNEIITNGQSIWSIPSQVGVFPTVLDTTFFIKGKAIALAGTTQRLPLLSVFSEIDNQFYYIETDAAGNFVLPLPDFNATKSIQFTNFQQGNIQVDLINQLPISRNTPLLVNESLLNYLEWSRKRKKLLQLFNVSEEIILEEVVNQKVNTLKPDRRFILEEYEYFNTMYDLCKEVSSPLKFKRNKDGSIYAQMFNPARGVRRFYSKVPIFIIDGKVTKDPEFVNQLDMNQVTQVDLFFDKEKLAKIFGPMGYGGVVIIQTTIPTIKMPEAEENTIFEVNGLVPMATYLPFTPVENQPLANTPIFRTNQYWMANRLTNDQGHLDFSFFQTDDLGTFQIEIVAQDEVGNIGTATTTFFIQQ